ncbi:MAG: hypothetical protein LBS58_01355 [Coriobacteriales bacterium]|nr:hypothetical protein [Coriobacteriales bacterium]
MSYEVIPIGDLMDTEEQLKSLEQRLGGFACSRDKELEGFIRNKALGYEIKGFSRTYLVIDTAVVTPGAAQLIAAFFTLAITATNYESISNSRKERVLGSKPGRNSFKAFPGLLVAQLARDDRYSSDFIDGEALLFECENFIELARKYVGGRTIYLDCKEQLVATYQKSGYRLLADASSEEGYFKMYKVLPDKVAA